jgi:hypothetical protein
MSHHVIKTENYEKTRAPTVEQIMLELKDMLNVTVPANKV